jgi:exosome complex RNA-binding protein Rrp4
MDITKQYVRIREQKDKAFNKLKLLLSDRLKEISLIVKETGIGIEINGFQSPTIIVSNNGIIYYYKNECKKEILWDNELKVNERRILIEFTKTIIQFEKEYIQKLTGMLDNTNSAIRSLEGK